MAKYVKTFEQFIFENDAVKAPDSKEYIDDVIIKSGKTVKAAEILGAITASETEEEFKSYFFEQYGNDAFTVEDMSKLLTYFNKYQEEKNAKETEEEEKEKEKEDAGDEANLDDLTGDLGPDSADDAKA